MKLTTFTWPVNKTNVYSPTYAQKGVSILAITNLELNAKLEWLVDHEKHSLKQAAIEAGVSVTTVRRICRTLGLGRYAHRAKGKGALSRSSQVPLSWAVEQGVFKTEQKYIQNSSKKDESGSCYGH